MKISKAIISILITVCMLMGIVGTMALGVSGATVHSHCVCGGSVNIGDHTEHSALTFTEWTTADSMPDTAGNYVLMTDVTILDTWNPADGTVLCLNGHTLSVKTIVLLQSNTFKICDCSGGGKVVHSVTASRLIDTYHQAKLFVFGGTYQGSFLIEGSSTQLTMYGGKISGADISGYDGKDGGGVALQNSGNFTMYGGEISNNIANDSGGGVFVEGNSTFIMNGGTISGNSSIQSGGGVQNAGTFIMNGGTITQNESKFSHGGGVWSGVGAPISISGNAVIEKNKISGAENNLHLAGDGTNDASVTIGTMTSDARIGISLDQNHAGVISTGGLENINSLFSDYSDRVLVFADGKIKLINKSAYFVSVGSVRLGDGEYTKDGITKISGMPTGTGYVYCKDGVLTLNGFELAAALDSSAIACEYFLDILVNGENTLSSKNADTMYLLSGYKIYGDGRLNIESDCGTGIMSSFQSSADIKDITLDITVICESLLNYNAIYAGDVKLDNAVLLIDSSNEGICSNATVARNSTLNIVSLKNGIFGYDLIDLDNCECRILGDVALSVNYNGEINIGKGKYILEGAHQIHGAIFVTNSTLNILAQGYAWKTNPESEYSIGELKYNGENYVELDSGFFTNILNAIKELEANAVELETAIEAGNGELEEKINKLEEKNNELQKSYNEFQEAYNSVKSSMDSEIGALEEKLKATEDTLAASIAAQDGEKANAVLTYVLIGVIAVVELAGIAGVAVIVIKKKKLFV